jgi:hypothetical protein
MENSIIIPNEDQKIKSLVKIDSLLNKNYLYEIDNHYSVLDFSDYNKVEKDDPQIKISHDANVRALRVDRWVFDKEEHNIDKFKNILNVFAGGESNLAILFKRDKNGTSLYFILKNETRDSTSKTDASNSDAELLRDAIIGNFNGTNIEKTDDYIPNKEHICSISCLTNIPSEKSEKFVSQGLEKLLEGVKPENENDSYYILILAEPLTPMQIQDIQDGYEELASAIVPYSGYQFSIGKNELESRGTIELLTDTENIFSCITKIHGVSAGINVGKGVIDGNASYNYTKAENKGSGESRAKARGNNYNLSVGKTENTTYNYQSFAIKGLLEKLQKQLERINNGKSLGLWKCASYVLASTPTMSINVANFLKSLTQGDESYIEPPIINTWHSGNSESRFFKNILEYLICFTHPVFREKEDKEFFTPTYNVTTIELADIMVFPRKSVSGLPVLECAAFGREVVTFSDYQGDIPLGSPYHMYKEVEEKQPSIKLDKESLRLHTFITGSTGSGKSNTIYQFLNEIQQKNVHFLVIEPSKGEYKHIFGNNGKVSVFGTNPELMPLLRINPFAFPNGNEDPAKNIHILEHLDRLIEIFNVCWPMYAAMPAVLKEAVEKSYENTGWDLQTSKNCYQKIKYPTFLDVMINIREIIDTSEYSDENKGNYKGALITRLKSLTNGLNGLIFTTDTPKDCELFDKNVIVDLSRVGSMETKALYMGILVMKLQEYRMTSGAMNSDLVHITVLEEAHNILRRTSTEQTSESANLLGKSVEMLANAIAEMRTYGEGFIIADQSPGLLDMSVIRNTNTKIIMRLPDQNDRELVGKAANLNDDQITELARLECGVAAIYQNNWLQPILCKVKEYEYDKKFKYKKGDTDAIKKGNAIMALKSYALNNTKVDNELKEKIESIGIDSFKTLEPELITSLFHNSNEVFKEAIKKATFEKTKLPGIKDYLVRHLEPSLSNYIKDYSEHILTCIVLENCRKDSILKELPKMWNDFIFSKEAGKDGKLA